MAGISIRRIFFLTWTLLLPMQVLAQVQTPRFPIRRFAIEGNTLLPAATIDRLLAPYIGPKREYGDIQRALEALELAYRKRGYAAVQVYAPEQELTSGVIRLQVLETVLGHLTLDTRLKYFDAANIRAALPALKEGTTPNALALSSQIALNNENPAKKVEVILGLGKKEGTVDAKVKVAESNPLRFSLSLDNTGTAQTGNDRLSFAVQDANMFDRDQVLSAAYVTSPEKPKDVAIGSVSYRIPFYAQASALDFIYAKSNVDAGTTATTAGPLSFTGKGDTFAARYTHALPRQGDYSAKLIAGFDVKAYVNDCSLGVYGALGCGPAAASVTLKPLSFSYSGLQLGPGRAIDYNLTLVQNLPGGDKGDDAAFRAVRPSPIGVGGVTANYHILRGGITLLKLFHGDWQMRAAANGQWTDQPLLPQEQIGLAGSTAVRGFLEREVARDVGAYVNLEGYSPDLAAKLGWKGASLRALVFYDLGNGHNNLLPGEVQPPHDSLASVGCGLRYGLGKDLAARLDIARVTIANGAQNRGDVRAHFSLSASF